MGCERCDQIREVQMGLLDLMGDLRRLGVSEERIRPLDRAKVLLEESKDEHHGRATT